MIDLQVNIKFISPFSDSERKAIKEKIDEIADRGFITMHELKDLVPGFEHRKISFSGWKRGESKSYETLVLVLES